MRLLAPFGWLYGACADVRNTLYDRGTFATHDLGARTISIGNITAGGTGKTPLVALTSRLLIDKGEKVCILTRGYGRRDPRRRVVVSDGTGVTAGPSDAGDEPYELAAKLNGAAVVIADADRVDAAAWARENFEVTTFILDDAFQHRRARRDLDIVCVDALDPFGGRRALPAGRLREHLGNLARADAVVIARANLVPELEAVRQEVSRAAPETRVFVSEIRLVRSTPLVEFDLLDEPRAGAVPGIRATASLAFCGLGNPESFFRQLRFEKFRIAVTARFRDHHRYRQADIDKLERKAREAGADILLTTPKDAVKLSGLRLGMPCFVVESEMVVREAGEYRQLVTSS